ncbi:putative retrotransposon gag domain-containing protein [Helianthus annuus]|nr:putative retrotransposon gag domain-containing protein [Helianthus annuus]
MTWEEFIALIKENYCPQHEVEKIEADFVSLVMTNLDCQAYLTSFNTMSRLVPYLVTPESRRIARFIGGLEPAIKASESVTPQPMAESSGHGTERNRLFKEIP